MRQLDMGFGEELRRRRVAAGLSLRELAVRVHYSRGYLSKVETRRAPASVQLARLCDAALQAGGELVALAQPGDRFEIPVVSAGEMWIVTMGPTSGSWFTTGGTRGVAMTSSSSVDGLRLAMSMPRHVGRDDAQQATEEAFRAWLCQLRALGQQVSSAVLLPMLIAQTNTLRQLAASAQNVGQRDFWELASRYAEYTGWMSQEAGDDRAALWWTSQAAQFAAAAGDQVMSVYSLVRRALISLYRNDHAQAISLSRHAESDVRSPARVRGLAALHEAQGLALAGAYDDCQRALDRARTYLAQPHDDQHIPILGTSTIADPANMVAGWCLYDLGRPKEAASTLDKEIARLPKYAYRSHARFATRQALAVAATGEIDYACALAHQLLPAAHDVASATIRIDLRRLGRVLGRWPHNRAVRDLQPHIDSALASGP